MAADTPTKATEEERLFYAVESGELDRLVLADWFEERGDFRGELLRLAVECSLPFSEGHCFGDCKTCGGRGYTERKARRGRPHRLLDGDVRGRLTYRVNCWRKGDYRRACVTRLAGLRHAADEPFFAEVRCRVENGDRWFHVRCKHCEGEGCSECFGDGWLPCTAFIDAWAQWLRVALDENASIVAASRLPIRGGGNYSPEYGAADA